MRNATMCGGILNIQFRRGATTCLDEQYNMFVALSLKYYGINGFFIYTNEFLILYLYNYG